MSGIQKPQQCDIQKAQIEQKSKADLAA